MAGGAGGRANTIKIGILIGLCTVDTGKGGEDERWLNFRSGGKEREKIGRKS